MVDTVQRASVNSPSADLTSVFGDRTDSIRAHIRDADTALRELQRVLVSRSAKDWSTDGVCVDTYPSGQVFLTGYVESSDITFAVELERESEQGSWEISTRVLVHSGATIDEGQDVALELRSLEASDAEGAALSFVRATTELVGAALSREPNAESWRSSVA
jgi:hypothetical protein